MKICLISNLYSPYIIGGAEINAERLAVALSNKDDVFVITTKPFRGPKSLFVSEENSLRIKVFRFYPLNLYHLYFSKKRRIPSFVKALWHCIDLFNIHTFFTVLHILKKERPAIVHTHNLDGLSFSVFWAAKALRIPLVHTVRDYHLLCPYANFTCPLTRFKICPERSFVCQVYSFLKKLVVNNIPAVVTAPSRFVLKIHKRFGFFKSTITETVPNFVVGQKKFPSQEKTGNTLEFLYTGRLSKEKGVDVLIVAFKDTKEDFLRLNIVGDGPERRRLEDLAAKDKRIKFHGKVILAEIGSFYSKADVLVVPSVWYEVFGVVVIEAFSFGIPVIGSKIGGPAELITHRFNGFLFEPGNVARLGEIFDTLSRDFKQDKELLNNLKKNALESVKKYDSKKITLNMQKVYDRAVEASA